MEKKFEDILNQLSEKDRKSLLEDYHEEYLRHKKTIENIYKQGLLHDIGKIGVSNRIINKPGKLTAEEEEEKAPEPVDNSVEEDLKQRPTITSGNNKNEVVVQANQNAQNGGKHKNRNRNRNRNKNRS